MNLFKAILEDAAHLPPNWGEVLMTLDARPDVVQNVVGPASNKIVAMVGGNVEITSAFHHGHVGEYNPDLNKIRIRPIEHMISDDAFIWVLAHEAVHYIGWQLDKSIRYLSNQEISREEYVAIVGSALLLAEIGMSNKEIARLHRVAVRTIMTKWPGLNLNNRTCKDVWDDAQARVAALLKGGK